MKITADTNLLLRVTVQDDPAQARVAEVLLSQATLVAVPAPVLCEFVWVLKRTYGRSSSEAAAAIEAILRSRTVSTDFPAVEAGLRLLRAGGDFADGVIAHQGGSLGGTILASFDRRAVARLKEAGMEAADPSDLVVRGSPESGDRSSQPGLTAPATSGGTVPDPTRRTGRRSAFQTVPARPVARRNAVLAALRAAVPL